MTDWNLERKSPRLEDLVGFELLRRTEYAEPFSYAGALPGGRGPVKGGGA